MTVFPQLATLTRHIGTQFATIKNVGQVEKRPFHQGF